LSECHKIDRLIWLYPDISLSEKAELERHLAGCPECTAAFRNIKALRSSSENDKKILSEIDSVAFDAAVIRKIKTQKIPVIMPEKISNRYSLRMAFSFALAASVVLFLVKSISDLSEIPTPMTLTQKDEAKGDKYQVLNLELSHRSDLPSPAAGADEHKKAPGAPALKMKASPPELTVAKAPAPEKPGELLTKAPTSLADSGQTVILGMLPTAQPPKLSSAADTVFNGQDTVSVGAFSMADANIIPDKQSRAASMAEYYAAPGSVQVAQSQSSIVVTVEKVPQAVKIVIPEYPDWAKKSGLSSTLMVRARVESDGTIKQAEIVSCDAPGVGFEEAALKAAKESIFIPAYSNGINLPVWIIYPVKFTTKEQ
jgi:TonB family protein